jgi:hypothetical protein
MLKVDLWTCRAVDVGTPAVRHYIDRRQSDGVSNATTNRELLPGAKGRHFSQ